MRIDELLEKIKEILDADYELNNEFSTLIVTYKLQDSPDDEVVTDYPYITMRYLSEVSEESIGSYVSRDVHNDPQKGMFKDGVVSLYCWAESELDSAKIGDYAEKALFRERAEHMEFGLLDICEYQLGQTTPSRAGYDAYRTILRFRVWYRKVIT